MTVFSTRGFANSRLESPCGWRQALRAWLLAGLLAFAGLGQALAAELTALRTERVDDGIYLSANVKFELPPVVEDALMRGIALIFVADAEIYRERWYWTDKRVASATRSQRLAYQPLTRRWRVSQGGEPGAGLVALAQSYDTLAEALAAVERVARWRIAEAADVDASNHTLSFRFRIDLSQLPRPFQIGIAGQREWQISIERSQRLRLERQAPEASVGER
jgi:hypothetical protein